MNIRLGGRRDGEEDDAPVTGRDCRPFCQRFHGAFESVGLAFAAFCEELKDEIQEIDEGVTNIETTTANIQNTVNEISVDVDNIGVTLDVVNQNVNEILEILGGCCPCKWVRTTGPVYKDVTTRSWIARAMNLTTVAVSVKSELVKLDGSMTPIATETITINPGESAQFTTVDISDPAIEAYYAKYSVTVSESEPPEHVCNNVFLFCAGRTDLAAVTTANSHMTPAETFHDANLVEFRHS